MAVEMNKVVNFKFNATSDLSGQLKDYRGKVIVLYFYPRDNTPGCTSESIDFTEQYEAFKKLNVEVFGLSRDTLASHHRFKEKYQMPFELIADPEEIICNQFEVIKPKNMYGKKVKGIERSTFIIDEKGKLIHEWRKVKVPGHVEEVLAFLQKRQ